MANQLDINDLEKLNEIRDKIIQSIAENMHLYGITDSVGRLYGTLYFSNRPLNLNEMRNALGMSKTSMSTGVRSLLDTKMVRKVWKKGERKDLYQTEEDWYKAFFDYFSTRWIIAIEANLKILKEAEIQYKSLLDGAVIEQLIKDEVATDLHKIKEIKNYYQWLKSLINTFETGEIFDLVPKPHND